MRDAVDEISSDMDLSTVALILGALYALAALALLSRCSLWAHETQMKLDKTNELLERATALLTEINRRGASGHGGRFDGT